MDTNPYPRLRGMHKRVSYAVSRLKQLCDRWDARYRISTRGFDNCFEEQDGDAVVWQIMHRAIGELLEGNLRFRVSLDQHGVYRAFPDCPTLLKGVINAGFFPYWLNHYRKTHALEVERFHDLLLRPVPEMDPALPIA